MSGQKQTNEIQRFVLLTAPGWRLFNTLIHLLVAALVLMATPAPFRTVPAVLLLVLILLASAWWNDGQFALRRRTAIRVLQHDADGWAVGHNADNLYGVQLCAGTFVSSNFVVLSWQRKQETSPVPLWRRRGQLLLTPTMLGRDDYRRLCRQLWQYQTDQQSVT